MSFSPARTDLALKLIIQCLLWNCGSFADPDQWGSVPFYSLGMQGLIVWLYHSVSLSPVRIVSRDPFSVFLEASTSTWLQKGRSMGNGRTEKAAYFLHARQIHSQKWRWQKLCRWGGTQTLRLRRRQTWRGGGAGCRHLRQYKWGQRRRSRHAAAAAPEGRGGPVQDLSNFQMASIPFLSDQTCFTHSPHDILKVWKKMTITCPLGVSNVTSML